MRLLHVIRRTAKEKQAGKSPTKIWFQNNGIPCLVWVCDINSPVLHPTTSTYHYHNFRTRGTTNEQIYEYAKAHGFDWVAIHDGDGTFDNRLGLTGEKIFLYMIVWANKLGLNMVSPTLIADYWKYDPDKGLDLNLARKKKLKANHLPAFVAGPCYGSVLVRITDDNPYTDGARLHYLEDSYASEVVGEKHRGVFKDILFNTPPTTMLTEDEKPQYVLDKDFFLKTFGHKIDKRMYKKLLQGKGNFHKTR